MSSLLNLELSLPGTNQTLEAAGRVIWLTDKEIQAHCYPGMGVSFVHLTSEKEKAIVDFIDKNITHRAEPF
ncbi:MAG: PilZ domain-containing protein, partial [Candidatus Omnitrophota bacterium]|nr:PilZ domain-containing protein [Candidatus Omnitrophota bacterium]